VEEDIPILPSHRLVILEGNYIHLTVPPWDQAARLLDEKWFILVEKEVSRARVVKRHVMTGVAGTDEEAHKRFGENDWINGEYILNNSDVDKADRRIWSIQDQVMAHESATVS
jgi:pantothenate kinase